MARPPFQFTFAPSHALARRTLPMLKAVNHAVELTPGARLKSSIEHFAQFLPLQITTQLVESYDFATLDTHLANMSAAALAASMPPTNLANKTDKAAAGAGAKRKAAASRGVEALKKVNTASMTKLTSFFKPKDK